MPYLADTFDKHNKTNADINDKTEVSKKIPKKFDQILNNKKFKSYISKVGKGRMDQNKSNGRK